MNLLFVIPEYPPHQGGGIITYYQSLLPELASRGHSVQVLVATAYDNEHPAYGESGVSVQFVKSALIDHYISKFGRFRAVPQLQRYLATAWAAWEQVDAGEAYDAVETTDFGLLFAPWIVDGDSPPTLVQLHGSLGQIDAHDPKDGEELQGDLIRLIETTLLEHADWVQTHSTSNRDAWRNLLGRDDVECIFPAWKTPCSPRGPENQQSPFGLVVARIQQWKGPHILCEALQLLGEEAPVIEWVGRDTQYKAHGTSTSEVLAGRYPAIWGQKVRPLGPCPPDETRRRQAAARFVVVPSTWDVFNFTVVEAMALERVVVCSTGAGASGLIEDGENGFLYDAEDPQELADVLRRLNAAGQNELERMGRLARKTIEIQLDPYHIVQERLALFKAVIEEGTCRTRRPSQWVIDACSPQPALQSPLSFLDQLPLRILLGYVSKRSIQKARQFLRL